MKRTKRMLWSWLVVAAALTTGFTACTNDDPVVGASNELENAQKVQITVSAGIADDASTRSAVDISTDANGKKHTLKFTEGDKLYVYGRNQGPYPVKGTLTMVENSLSPDGKSAQFTGSLQQYNGNSWDNNPNFGDEDPLAGTEATLIHKDMVENTDYLFFDNQIEFLSYQAPDIETLMTKNLRVTGGYNSSTKSFALSSNNTIFNCVFTGLTPSATYHCRLQYPLSGSGYSLHGDADFTTDAKGMSSYAFRIPYPGDETHPWEIVIVQNGSTVGTISLGTRTLEKKIYNVSRHWNGSAFDTGTDLSKMTNSYEAQNGEMLTGVFGAGEKQNWNVKIADGATVILNNVDITNVKDDNSNPLAGIICEGDATIILCGTNTVKNGHYNKPAILVPSGKTLTIRGSGKLTATSDGGAGIGGGRNHSCGTITIKGGIVNATSSCGTGIGSGELGSCGAITISGGNVTATCTNGVGIGSGNADGNNVTSSCGTITISGGTVNATGTNGAGIGCGNADGDNVTSSCGTITISGGNVTATSTLGAGIGSGRANNSGSKSTCTAIEISGGTVNATSTNGAGIGSGDTNKSGSESTCGAITISGGTINAESTYGAGIGTGTVMSGGTSTCGAITIYDTVTKVTARTSSGECSIGKGLSSTSCGTIIIGGTEYWNGNDYIDDGDTYLKQKVIVYQP